MKTWQLISVVSIGGLAAYSYGQRSGREELDELRGSVQAVASKQRASGRAAASLARPAEPVAERAVDAPRDFAPSATPAREAPVPPDLDPATPAAPRIDAATLRAHLSTTFDRQEADAAWSGAASRMLETKLAGLMPPAGRLRSVACKQTLCRVEMIYDDAEQYQAFFQRLTPDALPWNGTMFSSSVTPPDGAVDGPTAVVAFVSREGEALPVD